MPDPTPSPEDLEQVADAASGVADGAALEQDLTARLSAAEELRDAASSVQTSLAPLAKELDARRARVEALRREVEKLRGGAA